VAFFSSRATLAPPRGAFKEGCEPLHSLNTDLPAEIAVSKLAKTCEMGWWLCPATLARDRIDTSFNAITSTVEKVIIPFIVSLKLLLRGPEILIH
jgi:hypothetical protein